MKKYILKGSMLSVTTAVILGMSGCGDSNDSSDKGNTPPQRADS